jgi:hypothetical protein
MQSVKDDDLPEELRQGRVKPVPEQAGSPTKTSVTDRVLFSRLINFFGLRKA